MHCVKNQLPLVLLVLSLMSSPAAAQGLVFDFESTPTGTPLPIDATVGDVTAFFSGTGPFSIQPASTPGVTPEGFSGNIIYPSNALPADLLVDFSPAVQGVSIMYAPAEFGCDSTATMRMTGYRLGAQVATTTSTAPTPGTFPTGVLTLSPLPQGFDRVVIHYESPPRAARILPRCSWPTT